ncbi:MAG TPA: DUF2071 domain-containing protein [Planctomycetaceae bacterium]|nr:DUF2071 domain-containing protein [Planctomycetaceae bacterium]
MNFLSAHWQDLLMANYVVDPSCLAPYCPAGTRIDAFEGKTFVSLVAFMFDRTRIMGIPVPGHTRFEEVNLRFYVTPDHDPTIRAVTFIREFVPRPLIAYVANRLFNERYVACSMDHHFSGQDFSYSWGDELECGITASVTTDPVLPQSNSVEEFITEHYIGYSSGNDYPIEYEVQHPQWTCCHLEEFHISAYFAKNYGKEFAFLDDQAPYNVLYSPGSSVTATFPKRV